MVFLLNRQNLNQICSISSITQIQNDKTCKSFNITGLIIFMTRPVYMILYVGYNNSFYLTEGFCTYFPRYSGVSSVSLLVGNMSLNINKPMRS